MVDELHLSEKDFSLFSEVIASFHTIGDMDEMLVTILAKIKTIFDIEGASIAMHDPVQKEFYFIRMVENNQLVGHPNRSALRFPDHKGVAGWVMEHDQSVFINDVSDDRRYYDGFDMLHDFVTRSMICVPLRTRRSFLGVLYALNKRSGRFSERDKKLLEILSGTIAVSLENARFYGDLKDHLHILERERQILVSQAQTDSRFKEIIGSSLPMRRMFDLVAKIMDTTTTVLIQGETGTGKELVAKIIHYNGPLKDKAFVAENCGALPEELLESELFGHAKGAFTGAVTEKKGLFEIADGGTIFLDEIGEMPLLMQVKLLRVLQEGQLRPVGSNRTRQVNVRLIASTNRDLADEVNRGTFREDLYYRINVFQITCPPLRERKDDILELAAYFLEKSARKNKRPVPRLSPQAMDLLLRFGWPGNVRELENEMARAVAMAAGAETISAEMLSGKIRSLQGGRSEIEEASFSGPLKEIVRQVESRIIGETLRRERGNRSRTAKALGLSRQGLLNKIAALGIDSR